MSLDTYNVMQNQEIGGKRSRDEIFTWSYMKNQKVNFADLQHQTIGGKRPRDEIFVWRNIKEQVVGVEDMQY